MAGTVSPVRFSTAGLKRKHDHRQPKLARDRRRNHKPFDIAQRFGRKEPLESPLRPRAVEQAATLAEQAAPTFASQKVET